MNIDIDSANTSLQLNADTMDWSHFSSRPRYDKITEDDGTVRSVKVGYDRFCIGVLVGAKQKETEEYKYPFLRGKYGDDDIVTIFNLGHKNLVFAHKDGDSVIKVNKNIRSQAVEYVKFYARAVRKKVGEVTLEFVDDFPTSEIVRSGGGRKVDSLEALINKAINTTMDVEF